MDTFDERVRQRAYRLWVEEGCPEGRSDIHWEKARELVGIEEKQKSTTRPAAAEAPRREPAAPVDARRNGGGHPTVADQDKQQSAPKRAAAARAPAKVKTSAPKSSKEPSPKRR